MSEPQGVLVGVTVVDLTVARAGPTAVRQLADWGASVVRVEAPRGDEGVVLDHDSSDYINLHSNKRVISIDLKSSEGHEIIMKLLDRADVVVENFRAPVKHHLGIAYEDVADRCPRLIYGSICGYGQDGPRADLGAVDQIIQGVSGLMSITGVPGGEPMRVGVALADMAAGVLLANGILLALLERERSGRGQWVQVSLLEALVSFLDFQAVRWTIDGEVPEAVGNDHPTLTPMGTFLASDGYLNVAAPSDRLWRRLCAAIGAEHLIDDPSYATASDRHRNKAMLVEQLQKILRTRTRADWVAQLEAAGVPCGPVNTIPEMFADPQVEHLALTEAVSHAVRGRVSILRNPVTMSRTRRAARSAAPVAGQHTDEILGELGYSAADIAALRASGVV
jgi:crotonobetainyl-CoA:carnitine CoA-transferase CaiB-like acyl-CoA transferase